MNGFLDANRSFNRVPGPHERGSGAPVGEHVAPCSNLTVSWRVAERCLSRGTRLNGAIALAGLLTIGAASCLAATVGSTDMVVMLSTLEKRIQDGQLKEAEQELLESLDGLGPQSTPGTAYHQLTMLLAEVYFKSNSHDRALHFAELCRNHLQAITGDNFILAQRRDIALLLMQIQKALGENESSVSFGIEALQLNQRVPPRMPTKELELLFEVGRVLYETDAATNKRHLDQARTRVERLKDSISTEIARRRITKDDYRTGVRLYANYLADTFDAHQAVEQLARYESTADTFGRLVALKKIGDIHRRMVETPGDLDATGVIEHLAAARQKYEQARNQLRELTNEDVPISLELAILQSLQSVLYALYSSDSRNDGGHCVTAKVVVDVGGSLIERLNQAGLASDRRAYQARTILGAVHLREGQLDTASKHLRRCKDYWVMSSPPAHDRVLQCMILLSDAAQKSGNRKTARDILREALVRVLQEPSAELQLKSSIFIKLCRLYLAEGQVGKAMQVIKQAGDPPANLACYVELANYYIRRNDSIEPNDPIRQDNLFQLARTVDAASRIRDQGTIPHDDPLAIQSRDQHAVFHYLSDDPAKAESTIHREAARALWLENLDVQERQINGVANEKARTLYYLATLNYRDWRTAFEKLLRTRQAALATRTTEYDSRRTNYDRRLDEYPSKLDHYKQDLDAYHSNWENFKRNTRGVGLRTLARERQRLLETKRLLDIERDALIALAARLDDEYGSAKESVAESIGKAREALVTTLDTAKQYARRADALVKENDVLKARLTTLILNTDNAMSRTTETDK